MARRLEWESASPVLFRTKCNVFEVYPRQSGKWELAYRHPHFLLGNFQDSDSAKEHAQHIVNKQCEAQPAFLAYVESLERENERLRKRVEKLETKLNPDPGWSEPVSWMVGCFNKHSFFDYEIYSTEEDALGDAESQLEHDGVEKIEVYPLYVGKPCETLKRKDGDA